MIDRLLLEVGPDLRIVASDGHRLSLSAIVLPNPDKDYKAVGLMAPTSGRFLADILASSKECTLEWAKVVEDQEETLIGVYADNWTAAVKLSLRHYLNYRSILQDLKGIRIVLDQNLLVSALNSLKALSDEEPSVTLKFHGQKIELKRAGGKYEVPCELGHGIDLEADLSLNIFYLHEAIRLAKGKVIFHLTPDSHAKVLSFWKEGIVNHHLIMPIQQFDDEGQPIPLKLPEQALIPLPSSREVEKICKPAQRCEIQKKKSRNRRSGTPEPVTSAQARSKAVNKEQLLERKIRKLRRTVGELMEDNEKLKTALEQEREQRNFWETEALKLKKEIGNLQEELRQKGPAPPISAQKIALELHPQGAVALIGGARIVFQKGSIIEAGNIVGKYDQKTGFGTYQGQPIYIQKGNSGRKTWTLNILDWNN